MTEYFLRWIAGDDASRHAIPERVREELGHMGVIVGYTTAQSPLALLYVSDNDAPALEATVTRLHGCSLKRRG